MRRARALAMAALGLVAAAGAAGRRIARWWGVTSLSPGALALHAAQGKGFLEAEGLAVETPVFRSGTDNAQAILANEVHVGIENVWRSSTSARRARPPATSGAWPT